MQSVVPAGTDLAQPVMSGVLPDLLRPGLRVVFCGTAAGTAYLSGFKASEAMAEDQPPEVVGHRVDEGIALGFRASWPVSVVVLIIMVWS